jgi:hypothetical protein
MKKSQTVIATTMLAVVIYSGLLTWRRVFPSSSLTRSSPNTKASMPTIMIAVDHAISVPLIALMDTRDSRMYTIDPYFRRSGIVCAKSSSLSDYPLSGFTHCSLLCHSDLRPSSLSLTPAWLLPSPEEDPLELARRIRRAFTAASLLATLMELPCP